MSLIDELRSAAESVPPSHRPTAAEALGVLGALIHFEEFGAEKFFEASQKGQGGVSELIASEEKPKEEEDPTSAGQASAPGQEHGTPVAATGPSPFKPDDAGPPASASTGTGGSPASDPRDEEILTLKQQIQTLIADRERNTVVIPDFERNTVTAEPPESSNAPFAPGESVGSPFADAGGTGAVGGSTGGQQTGQRPI